MAKTTNGYRMQAQLFRALSHSVRLRILDIVARQEACVCHLTEILGQRQPYVSQQLATLREAGLVTDRRDGTLIYYRLADDALMMILDQGMAVVQHLAGDDLAFAPVPEGALANCPCPRCQGEG
jgi:DNA-binding transcriptional ArsR family regulator